MDEPKRTPPAPAQRADHQHPWPALTGPERRVEDFAGGGVDGRGQRAAQVEHGQCRAHIPRPVPERGEAVARAVGEVFQVEQRTAASLKPPQQLARTLLPLVRVAEEHMPVPQRHGTGWQLLQTDDHRVVGRAGPGTARRDRAPRRGVLLGRERALRRFFNGQRHAGVDQAPGIAGHDRCPVLARPFLASQPQPRRAGHPAAMVISQIPAYIYIG